MPTPEDVRERGAHDLADDAWIKRIVEASGATAGEVVLDVGAGLGALTAPLAEAVMPGGEVVAYLVIGAQLALVQSYAKRYAEVSHAAEKPYGLTAAGGFMLGFELGVRAARLERPEQ